MENVPQARGSVRPGADRPSADEHAETGPDRAFAALDLGTNNCRLLIAAPEDGHFRVLDAFSRNVRLGEGVEQTGRLCLSAMDRTVEALKICATKIDRADVSGARIVATEACRRAENAGAFLDRVRYETGLDLEVISPEVEARLAVAGCAPLVTPDAEHVMVFDIGGGSTELVWVDLTGCDPAEREDMVMAIAPQPRHARPDAPRPCARARARIVDWVSVPLGVATLQDKFSDVTDDRKRYALMSWFFEEFLADFAPYRDHEACERRIPGLQLIGASGTVTTMGGFHLGLKKYDRKRVDGLWLETEDVAAYVEQLINLGSAGRCAHPCVGRDRDRLIISGAAILATILRIWPVERLRVADRGLREGMLYALMRLDRTRT